MRTIVDISFTSFWVEFSKQNLCLKYVHLDICYECYHMDKGEWGIICDDGWDLIDATTVCNQLRYGNLC